ncbi:endonuclease/exonuclease/phosphatase family protein [Verrucomicrobiota bacterium]
MTTFCRRRGQAIHRLCLFGILFCGALAVSAGEPETPVSTVVTQLTVVQWNVENLFDTEDDPENEGDDPFSPGGWQYWTEKRYRTKLDHLAEMLERTRGDIVCLEEVENRRVLDDLNEALRQRAGWNYPHIVHREGPDHRGIDVAVLSRFKPVDARWLTPVAAQRDILIVDFLIQDTPLTVLANHWKSRWGNKQEATKRRVAQARAAREEINRILQKNPAAPIMLVGDFNDDFDGPTLVEHVQSSPDREAVVAGRPGVLLFNLHATLPRDRNGTLYYYRGKTWNSFDGIGVSRSMIDPKARGGWQVKEGSYEIVRLDCNVNDFGKPKAFRRMKNEKTGEREYVMGYSDHFPVRVVITRRAD